MNIKHISAFVGIAIAAISAQTPVLPQLIFGNNADINDNGSVVCQGSYVVSNGKSTVQACRASVSSDTVNAFHYAFNPVLVPIDIIAKVGSISSASDARAALIWCRPKGYVNYLQVDKSGLISVKSKLTTTLFNVEDFAEKQASLPVWLRITIGPNSTKMRWSPDGTTWVDIGPVFNGGATLRHNQTGEPMLVGIAAITNHDPVDVVFDTVVGGQTPESLNQTILNVSPVLEWTDKLCNGSYVAHFGYLNRNPFQVALPLFWANSIAYGGQCRSSLTVQPSLFEPGRKYNEFTVPFDGTNLVWRLMKSTSTASSNLARNACN